MAASPRPRAAAPRRPWPWIAGAGAVLVALLLAVALTAGGDDTTDASTDLVQAAPVEVAGSPLPMMTRGADPAVGTTAPTVVGTSFDGSVVTIGPGRPTLVLFLAHWCPHCQREVTLLVDHFDDGGRPDGVDVIAVATATYPDRPNYPPSSWLEDEGWTTPVMVDSEDFDVAEAFGLPSFPFLVGLDASGRVVGRIAGEFSAEEFDALAALARG